METAEVFAIVITLLWGVACQACFAWSVDNLIVRRLRSEYVRKLEQTNLMRSIAMHVVPPQKMLD